MKTIVKTTYLLLSVSTLLSSCGQADVPGVVYDGSDRRIVFHTYLPELTTKASEIVTGLDYLYLTAFNESDPEYANGGILREYFKNEKIDKSAVSGMFCSDRCIWPEPGRESDKLHFFAYYPELPLDSLVNGSTASGGSVSLAYRIRNFRVAPDIADQVDFVTSYATGSMADNLFSGIILDFRHQLSRVDVKAKGSHKSCDIEIAGVAIGSTPMQATFDFPKSDNAEVAWTDVVKGNAIYIFCQGDAIVTAGVDPVSIMGSKIDDENENSAMVIPSVASAWDYSKDIHNEKGGLYLNVLLRIIDKTPTGNGKQQYPYYDNSQGLNAMNIDRIYLAVNNAGIVTENPGKLYKDDSGKYYTDSVLSTPYVAPQGSEVKEFGWAAVPITGEWEPGKIYTYTLDYTYGVGVHGPETPGDVAPMAGDPVISDRVGVSMSVKAWQVYNVTGTVEVPGS